MRRPWPIGEYARGTTPRRRHSARRPEVSGPRRRSENSIWLDARDAAFAELVRDRPHLLDRVVGDPDGVHQPGTVQLGQALGEGRLAAQADRTVDLVEVDAVDAEPFE